MQHNWALFQSEEAVAEGEDPIAATDLDAGPITQVLDFGPLTDGEYYYQCDAHPGTMFGNLIVGAAAAALLRPRTPRRRRMVRPRRRRRR